jgi:hypothetical protein
MKSSRFDLFASWLLGCRLGRFVLWWMERVAFVFGLMVMGWGVYTMETHFLPVIKDWRMEYVYRDQNYYVLGGTFEKTRACELVATSVLAVPKMPLAPRQLIYQIKPNELLGGNAPMGKTTWGPWRMEIPKALLTHREDISFLEVIGHHRCHAGWTQETLYGTVRMEELP